MDKKFSVGVIGHVDHGKTSLVKALTGIDTDRLKEEKERGLSIVLGFSFLKTKNSIIDIIDAPGHENFIRTMVSGATGVNGVMLIIAANEGIQEQTYEHFNIAKLLNIKSGLVVITKTDLATPQSLNKVQEQINELTSNTFLESAPIIYTSTETGDGIEKLKLELDQLAVDYSPMQPGDYFYLPIDRVFTINGTGTVVTGTLRNGTIQVNNEVEVMPNGMRSQIRGIEVHKKVVDKAFPGERVAINLRYIEKQQLSRGDSIVTKGYLKPTHTLNAELSVLDNIERIPSRNEPIKLLFGTTEVIAKYKTLDRKKLQAGHTSLVQFLINDEVVTPIDNLFVVRTCSPPLTLGGGRIIDNSAANGYEKYSVSHISENDPKKKILERIEASENNGVYIDTLGKTFAIPIKNIREIIDTLPVILIEKNILLAKSNFSNLCAMTSEFIRKFHIDNPCEIGVSVESIRKHLPNELPAKVFRYMQHFMLKERVIRKNNSKICLYEFNPIESLNREQKIVLDEIESTIKSGKFQPAELKDVIGGSEYKKKLYTLLKETGKIIEIKNNDLNRPMAFHQESIDELISILKSLYPQPKLFTVSDVRNNLGTSRKYTVPLLEYLDTKKITIRDGDIRKVLNTNH